MTFKANNMFTFLTREQGLKRNPKFCYDVSSHGSEPFNLISPFARSDTRGPIPVPGRKGAFSNTVEGIWQGLKVIDGETNMDYFGKLGPKRKPTPGKKLRGWLYGNMIIDVVTARRLIYLPAYHYHWARALPDSVKNEMVNIAIAGNEQFLYDFETNPDPEDPFKSYAHAHLACYLLEGRLAMRIGKGYLMPEPLFSDPDDFERILMIGSRTWTDFQTIETVVKTLNPKKHIIISGGAEGADKCSIDFAIKHGFRFEEHPANWRPDGVYNPQAGFERNAYMIGRNPTKVYAFRKNLSGGTSHTLRLADKKNIPVKIFDQ
jgi:hypothetical protein